MFPIRLLIGIMIFMSAFTNYMLRANMSVSVVEMSYPLVAPNATCKKDELPEKNATNVTAAKKEQDNLFHWTQQDQGQLIAAYFYGTMLTFFPGGTMAEQLGAVNVIFYTSVGSALLTALTPVIAVAGGFWATFTVRFIMGVLGGPVYPAMNTLVAKWAPPKELGKFLSTLLGNTIGVVVTWLMVGNTTARWGWEAGFYSVAAVMTLYCIVFFICTTDTPDKHRWITEEEKNYIWLAQGGNVSKKKKFPPYKSIFLSIHFHATVVAQFGNLWALNLMLSYAPKYFKETLGYNLKKAVALAATPYLLRLVGSQVFGVVGDLVRKYKNRLSLTVVRKVAVLISHVIPAICFCFIYAAGCSWPWVLVLLSLNQLLNGAVIVGHLMTCQDLAPNFAGTLYGIMNLIASTTGFIVPAVDAAILKHYKDDPLTGAAIIYWIGGLVLVGSAAFFFVFGSGEIQRWNKIDEGSAPQTTEQQ